MDADRKRTRRQIGDIPTKAEYLALMDGIKLTALERKICDMRYLDGQNMGFIADFLGFAEVTIKKHHAKALKKLAKVIGG